VYNSELGYNGLTKKKEKQMNFNNLPLPTEQDAIRSKRDFEARCEFYAFTEEWKKRHQISEEAFKALNYLMSAYVSEAPVC
jgi:hypothetical protein